MRAVVGNSRVPIASRVDLKFGTMLAGGARLLDHHAAVHDQLAGQS